MEDPRGAAGVDATDGKQVHLAGGCFWGVERYLSLIPGVLSTEAGYANSSVPKPSYELVCSGLTGAAEAVRCVYDPAVIGLDELLFMFFDIIDPTSINRQGHDVGSQYRTGIYYSDPADGEVARACLDELARRYPTALAVECCELEGFWPAEDYHQDYLVKNPQGYCHVPAALFEDVGGRLARLPRVRSLDNLSWAVTQRAATEPPFNNAYDHHFEPGIYVDIVTGEPLFSSYDKYDSGCGWPAFTQPIDDALLSSRPDFLLGYRRTEVLAAASGSHLGHVFDDGPPERGGLRYCINSAALRFVPAAEMEAEGYKDLAIALGFVAEGEGLGALQDDGTSTVASSVAAADMASQPGCSAGSSTGEASQPGGPSGLTANMVSKPACVTTSADCPKAPEVLS